MIELAISISPFSKFEEGRSVRIMAFLLSVLCLCISGCAPTQLPRSDIPAWDEGISLDSDGTEPPSLSDRLRDTFVGNSNYHFRKVRWGFSRERVELSETGKQSLNARITPLFINVKSTVSIASSSIRSRITSCEPRAM